MRSAPRLECRRGYGGRMLRLAVRKRMTKLVQIDLRVLICFVAFFVALEPARTVAYASAQSQRVVTDQISGLALYGYDPVAYFTEHTALRGKRDYEYVWKGVSWNFVSQANRAVFMADPEVYAPQYGGHGALAMARGFATNCNPSVWAIYNNRLYLFYSYTARAAWAEAVDLHVDRANNYWKEIEGTLSR